MRVKDAHFVWPKHLPQKRSLSKSSEVAGVLNEILDKVSEEVPCDQTNESSGVHIIHTTEETPEDTKHLIASSLLNGIHVIYKYKHIDIYLIPKRNLNNITVDIVRTSSRNLGDGLFPLLQGVEFDQCTISESSLENATNNTTEPSSLVDATNQNFMEIPLKYIGTLSISECPDQGKKMDINFEEESSQASTSNLTDTDDFDMMDDFTNSDTNDSTVVSANDSVEATTENTIQNTGQDLTQTFNDQASQQFPTVSGSLIKVDSIGVGAFMEVQTEGPTEYSRGDVTESITRRNLVTVEGSREDTIHSLEGKNTSAFSDLKNNSRESSSSDLSDYMDVSTEYAKKGSVEQILEKLREFARDDSTEYTKNDFTEHASDDFTENTKDDSEHARDACSVEHAKDDITNYKKGDSTDSVKDDSTERESNFFTGHIKKDVTKIDTTEHAIYDFIKHAMGDNYLKDVVVHDSAINDDSVQHKKNGDECAMNDFTKLGITQEIRDNSRNNSIEIIRNDLVKIITEILDDIDEDLTAILSDLSDPDDSSNGDVSDSAESFTNDSSSTDTNGLINSVDSTDDNLNDLKQGTINNLPDGSTNYFVVTDSIQSVTNNLIEITENNVSDISTNNF